MSFEHFMPHSPHEQPDCNPHQLQTFEGVRSCLQSKDVQDLLDNDIDIPELSLDIPRYKYLDRASLKQKLPLACLYLVLAAGFMSVPRFSAYEFLYVPCFLTGLGFFGSALYVLIITTTKKQLKGHPELFMPIFIIFLVSLPVLLSLFSLLITPGHNEDYFQVGMTCSEQKDYSCALSNFDQEILRQPDNSEVYFERGNVYRQTKDYEKAIKDYSEAIRLNPHYTESYYLRGWTYDEVGNYSLALNDLNEAISLDAQKAYFYNERGFAYLKTQKLTEATSDFSKALVLAQNEDVKEEATKYLETIKTLQQK